MIEVTACPICDGPERVFLFSAGDSEYGGAGQFSLVRCVSCGAGYLATAPSPEELPGYYPTSYKAHGSSHAFAGRVFSAMVGSTSGRAGATYYGMPIPRPLQGAARALDIGTGSGDLAGLLVANEWNVVGLEMSRGASLSAARKGLTVVRADAAHPPFEPNSFDLVVGSQVFEHLYRPVQALREYHAILRRNGALIVAVPNFGSYTIQAFGPHAYASLSIPRHLVFFTEKSLRRALGLAGFPVVDAWDTLFPAFLPSLLLKAGVSYRRLTGRLAGPVLSVMSLPIDGLTQRQGLGSGLVAIARKS